MATRIRIKRGTESQITGYTGTHYEGELAYATNTGNVFVSDGTAFINIGGGGETPTLQSVTDEGNTTTNQIFSGSHIITQANTRQLRIHYGGGNPVWGFTGASYFRIEKNSSAILSITSAENVGIGTTAPSEKLEVDGNIISTWNNNRFIGIQFEDGDDFKNGLVLKAGDRSTGLIAKASNNNPYIWFGTGSEPVSERMRITDTGNVGIGTTTPLYKLEVVGDARIDGGPFIIRGTNSFTTSSDTSGVLFNLGSGIRGFRFQNNNGELIRIDASGNVGIGTTAPAAKLEVKQADNADIQRWYNNNNLRAYINKSGDFYSGRFRSTGGSETYPPFSFDAANTTGFYYSSGLRITVGGTTRAIIDTSGNFGIGTTAPSQKLEVAGKAIIRKSGTATPHGDTDFLVTDATAALSTAQMEILGGNNGSSILYFSDPDAYNIGGIQYSHSTDSMNLRTNGSTKIQIESGGNVGIGTTAPIEKLHVSGNVIATGGTVTAFASNTSKSIISNVAGGGRLQLLSDDGDIYLRTKGGDSYFNAGNVGIGTTAPLYPLDLVSNSSTNTAMLRVRSTNDFGNIKFTSYDGTETLGSLYFQREGAGTGNLRFYTSNANNNQERLRITPIGNVGIGTTAPDSKLHVKATSGIAFKVDPNNADKEWYIDTTNPDHLKKEGNLILNADPTNVHTSTKISFNIDGSNKASINSDGDLGVGTTAQTSKVHVDGTAMRQLRMGTAGGPSSNTDTSGAIGDMAYDDNYFYIKTASGWGRVQLDFGF